MALIQRCVLLLLAIAGALFATAATATPPDDLLITAEQRELLETIRTANRDLQASNQLLSTRVKALTIEQQFLSSDVQHFRDEVNALDEVLAKIAAVRMTLRTRLAEYYQSNNRLRKALIERDRAWWADKPKNLIDAKEPDE